MRNDRFKFRRGDQIGAAAAEDDELLSRSFFDTGDLGLLETSTDHRVILLGRTGSGKSALLLRLAERSPGRCIRVVPENLALTYVSNSTIMTFLDKLGVNLDPFFKLLWRHVFVVEILKTFFETRPDRRAPNLLDRLRGMFTGQTREDKEMKEAVDYLEQWGKSFWVETEFRVKEITQKLEHDLDSQVCSQLGVPIASVAASDTLSQRLSETQKTELVRRAQDVIASAQVQDLSKVLRLLDAVLTDRQKPYFLLIDNLDENWVEERIRYRLVMALIVTARDFCQIKNAKVILALRRDLIDRVFRLTRDAGFQEEKYHSLYLPLQWNGANLINILDKRIDILVKRTYTRQPVTHGDLLPTTVGRVPIREYLVQRVSTPRDVIAFFNECIAAATNRSSLTVKEFSVAEGNYSRSRLRAVGDEWSADYPALLDFSRLLQRRPRSFKITEVEDSDVAELCLRVAAESPEGRGMLQQNAMKVVDCILSARGFKMLLMQLFYTLGLVGLKLQPHEGTRWAGESGRGLSAAELGDEASVVVRPMYHRALGRIHIASATGRRQKTSAGVR